MNSATLPFWKRIVFYAFGFFFSFLVLFLLLLTGEVLYRFVYKKSKQAFRVVHSDIGADAFYALTPTGWRLAPNVRGYIKNHPTSHKQVLVESNSLGYRNYELGDKTADQFRILVLGDSITLADYADEQDTYVRQLEALLRRKPSGKKLIQAINAGVGGIDLANEYYILKETGLSTKPDIVLIGLYLNDADQSVVIRPVLPYPYNRSKLIHFFYEKYLLLQEAYFPKSGWTVDKQKARDEFVRLNPPGLGDWKEDKAAFNRLVSESWSHWGFSFSEKAWEQMGHILEQIKEMEKVHGFRLVVALFPVVNQVEAPFLYDTPQQHMQKLSKQYDIPYLDLLPTLRDEFKKVSKIDELFYDHCHLTPLGNQITAREIARFLEENRFVPL